MTLTIKKVPTVVSIHQLDDDADACETDPKANLVSRVCAPGSTLPTLNYAPKRAAIKAMKKWSTLSDRSVHRLFDHWIVTSAEANGPPGRCISSCALKTCNPFAHRQHCPARRPLCHLWHTE